MEARVAGRPEDDSRTRIVAAIAERIRSSGTALLILLALFAAAFLLGPLVSRFSFGARELAILVLVILTALLVLIADERVIKLGFGLWILTFAFGWRTLYLTPNLNIHPSEVLIVLLFFLLFARAAMTHAPLDISFPLLLAVFMLFAALGVVTALFRGAPVDVIVEEFKPFAVIVPIYYVVKWLIKTREDWERATFLTVLVALYLGGLGLMDYFTPNLSHALTGNADIPTLYIDLDYGAGLFARVGFIFYGNFSAGLVIFTFLAFTIHSLLIDARRSWPKTAFLTVSLLVQISGIYLSGYRGLWYAMGVFLLAFALVRRRAWLLLGAAFIAVPFLPLDFYNRFQSIFNTTYADSSQYDRLIRLSYAVDLIKQSPLLGVGWGGSGYVHSDLAQIAANLGLPALSIFLLWISGLGVRVLRLTRRTDWIGGYACALFAAMCGILVNLSAEGLIVFVQLLIPVWFILAMAYKLIEMAKGEGTIRIPANPGRQDLLNTGGQ